MRQCLVLAWGFRLSLDFFTRGFHTRTAVARLSLRKLGFLVNKFIVAAPALLLESASQYFFHFFLVTLAPR